MMSENMVQDSEKTAPNSSCTVTLRICRHHRTQRTRRPTSKSLNRCRSKYQRPATKYAICRQ